MKESFDRLRALLWRNKPYDRYSLIDEVVDAGPEIFRCVSKCVTASKGPLTANPQWREVQGWVNWFAKSPPSGDSSWQTIVAKLKALLTCAEHVSKLPHSKRNAKDIQMVIYRLGEIVSSHTNASLEEFDEDWYYGCALSLWGAPKSSPTHVVAVTFGAESTSDSESNFRESVQQQQGALHTLICEVFDRGCGRVFWHPQDFMQAEYENQFKKSMQDAFDAALEHLELQPDYDGRYRILDGWTFDRNQRLQLSATKKIGGPSAGAAGFRAWCGALEDKLPDDRVVVLCKLERVSIESSVQLWDVAEVAGMRQKVKAVIESASNGSYLDTIVVTRKNFSEVEAAFDETRALRIPGVLGREEKKRDKPPVSSDQARNRHYFQLPGGTVFKVEVLE